MSEDRPLYGCDAVIEALGLEGIDHCSSCHSEMNYADESPASYLPRHWHSGRLSDGREYEDVCCAVSDAVKAKKEEGH